MVETAAALAEVVVRFAQGTGPVAVDAERASGYRYSQRAYLVQLRRAGAGTALIDPIACPDLSVLGRVLQDDEWVLHAASQDLACLAEVGLVPPRIFDTELGGRLAGLERVGLGAMVEALLGLHLEKGHSAADWSTRPLPEDWLVYAALDVEVLVELRDVLEAELVRQGKLDWAHEEFDAVLHAPPPPPRVDPWRRVSGLHRLRTRRQYAAVRALWQVRDEMARRRDTAPGRILPDAALVAAVSASPASPQALLALPVFGGRATRRHVDTWFGALQEAAALPEDALPAPLPAGDGAAPGEPLGRARPGGRTPARPRPGRGRGPRRAARPPDREPRAARGRPPAGLVAARSGERRRRRGGAAGQRRAPLAGHAGGRAARRGAARARAAPDAPA